MGSRGGSGSGPAHASVRCSVRRRRGRRTFNLHGDPARSPVGAFFWTAIESVRSGGRRGHRHSPPPVRGAASLLRSQHSAIATRRCGSDSARSGDIARRTARRPFAFASLPARRGSGGAALGQAIKGPRARDLVRQPQGPLSTACGGCPSSTKASGPPRSRRVCRLRPEPSLLDVERLRSNHDLRVIEFQQSSLAYLALDHETASLGFDDVTCAARSPSRSTATRSSPGACRHGWPAHRPIPVGRAGTRRRSSAFGRPVTRRGLDAARLSARRRRRPTPLRRARARGCDPAPRATRLVECSRASAPLESRPLTGFEAFCAALADRPDAFVLEWFWPDRGGRDRRYSSPRGHLALDPGQRASIPPSTAPARRLAAGTGRGGTRGDLLRDSGGPRSHLPLVRLSPATVWAYRQVQVDDRRRRTSIRSTATCGLEEGCTKIHGRARVPARGCRARR